MTALLTLSSVYAAQKNLTSIDDLTVCHLFEHTNILALLHWFAREINFESNIFQLTFDPNSDYGSHHYRNDEGILEPPPEGYRYYTVGNINRPTSRSLPSYVVDAQRASTEWNKARIIFRVREGDRKIIDQVYITQHYDFSEGYGSTYDPEHTYRITTNLLQKLRSHTFNEIQRLSNRCQKGHIGFRNDSHHHGSPSNQRNMRNSHDIQNTRTCSTCGWIACAVVFTVAVVIVICLVVYFGAGRK